MVVVDEDGCGHRRLIRHLRLLIEHLFPPVCLLQGLWIRSVCHDNASGYMPGVQRLESRLWIHIGPLVPQLHSHFLSVDFQNFEREIGVNSLLPFRLFVVYFGYAIFD